MSDSEKSQAAQRPILDECFRLTDVRAARLFLESCWLFGVKWENPGRVLTDHESIQLAEHVFDCMDRDTAGIADHLH